MSHNFLVINVKWAIKKSMLILLEMMNFFFLSRLVLGKLHNSLSSRYMRGVRINRSSDTQYKRGSAQTCLLHGLLQIFH